MFRVKQIFCTGNVLKQSDPEVKNREAITLQSFGTTEDKLQEKLYSCLETFKLANEQSHA